MPDPIPYDGPLAERAVDIEGLRSFVYVSISAERGPLRSFARKLLKRPIAVRAPGQKYVIWALIGFEYFDRYWIKLATYNLVWPQGGSPFTGDLGLAAEWMWRVLDHHGIADAAQARLGTDRAELVARVREMGPAAIEWVEIADNFEAEGFTVPPDIRDQPRLIEGTPLDEHGEPIGDSAAADRLAQALAADEDPAAAEWPGRKWLGERRGPGTTPAGLTEVDGIAVLDGIDTWTADEVDAARTFLSAGALDRPARVDGEPTTVDAAVDRLVARLAATAPVMRLRLTGLDPVTLDAAQSAMAFVGETVFVVDGEPGAIAGELLYDLYGELLFEDAGEDAGEG